MIGNLLCFILGFGSLLYISINSKLKLNIADLILWLIPIIILLPPLKLSNSIPAIRLEEIVFYPLFFTAFIVKLIKNEVIVNNRLVLIVTLFLVSMISSAIYINVVFNIGFSIRDFFEFAKIIKLLLILILFSSYSYDKKFVGKVINITIISLTISSLFGFMQYINLLGINNFLTPLYATSQLGNISDRIVGTTSNPNDFGIFLNIGLILLINYMMIKKKFYLLNFIGIFIFLLAEILTVSRTTILTTILIFIYLLFIYYKKIKIPKKYLFFILIFSILVGAIITMNVAQYFITRMASGINLQEDYSFLARLFNWQQNIEIWKKSPIFGWGPAKSIQTTIVDNEYILMLRRYGIIGVFFYILLYLIPLIDSKKALARLSLSKNDLIFTISMNAILIVFLLYNVTSVTLSNIQLMDLWIIFMAILYSRINEIKRSRAL